jgi:hypothetical protein
MSTDHLRERFDEAGRILSETSWSPDEGSAHTALDRLVDICTELFFGTAAIARTAPPVSMVAVHRQAARVVSRTGVAISVFLEALVAPFLDDARALQTRAQEALDDAGESAHRLGEFMGLTERQISMEPGWWATEDDYDTGRAVWEAMGAASATVSDGAQRVRHALGGVPGIDDLPDEFAFQLLPAVSLAFYDPVRLVEKARSARDMLDRAGSGWIGDAALLVSEILVVEPESPLGTRLIGGVGTLTAEHADDGGGTRPSGIEVAVWVAPCLSFVVGGRYGPERLP